MAMSYQKATRPSRQANGRASKSKDSLAHVSHDGRFWDYAIVAFVLFSLFVVPRIMYAFIAPMKGWI